jgi:Holliday junction resolvase RusA-like endonuclease
MKSMRIDIAVNPGDVSINKRFVPQWDRGKPTGRLILNPAYRSEVDVMRVQILQAMRKQGWKQSKRTCRVVVLTRWPGPNGDRDATCKAVLDAFEKAGAVVNDKQIIPGPLDAAWNCKNPGIEVTITEESDA